MSTPSAIAEPQGGHARRDAYRRFSRLRGQRLRRPRTGAVRLLVYALAAAIHALTLALLGAAAVIFAAWPANLLGWLFSAVLVAVAVLMRPRTVRPPKGAEAVSRQEAPALFAAADRIADAVGTARPAVVYLDDHYYSCVQERVGLRRAPALLIGLPLLAVLSPEERAGMLATELAQDVCGDPARTFFVRSALLSVAEWRGALLGVRVDRFDPFRDLTLAPFSGINLGRVGSQLIGKVTGWVIGGPLFLAELALTRLVAAQSQLAGYYADQVAARAVSARAVVGYLDALAMRESRLTPLLAAVRRAETVDQIRSVALAARTDPAALAGRRELSMARFGWRDLEPPIALRAALLEEPGAADGFREGVAEAAGATGVGRSESDRVDAELGPRLERALRELSQVA
ncbi:M48 family metallopeptidase [Microbispora sp. ATCC PTA-5024]|uniref:M48 family metallopeptidase n=1 Tax=Microbispora sp. ATCC PTA-5024 TaxID=316330 RepID=UPI0003DC9CA4|nr:M48 family metallopeptidase [Microbispora sp. ATCC PTA-5024]ETK35972.1 hypothetical protein MPTA5024_10135 [Microbispora sp. ATCC PTA-5024]